VQRFEVARLTARKAVRVLADEGLVEVVPGRGVYVAERD
jgi:DNA-binding GntR family transcriptional regulator